MTGRVCDVDGMLWTVAEARATPHGFDLLLGRPLLGGGRRGAAVILTADLQGYLERCRYPRGTVDLPLGQTALKSLRARLGYRFLADRAQFFDRRAEDLDRLTLAEFADRHRLKVGAAHLARAERLGHRRRSPEWWREPAAAEALTGMTAAAAAARLGISVGHVRKLRRVLMADAHATDQMSPT